MKKIFFLITVLTSGCSLFASQVPSSKPGDNSAAAAQVAANAAGDVPAIDWQNFDWSGFSNGENRQDDIDLLKTRFPLTSLGREAKPAVWRSMFGALEKARTEYQAKINVRPDAEFLQDIDWDEFPCITEKEYGDEGSWDAEKAQKRKLKEKFSIVNAPKFGRIYDAFMAKKNERQKLAQEQEKKAQEDDVKAARESKEKFDAMVAQRAAAGKVLTFSPQAHRLLPILAASRARVAANNAAELRESKERSEATDQKAGAEEFVCFETLKDKQFATQHIIFPGGIAMPQCILPRPIHRRFKEWYDSRNPKQKQSLVDACILLEDNDQLLVDAYTPYFNEPKVHSGSVRVFSNGNIAIADKKQRKIFVIDGETGHYANVINLVEQPDILYVDEASDGKLLIFQTQSPRGMGEMGAHSCRVSEVDSKKNTLNVLTVRQGCFTNEDSRLPVKMFALPNNKFAILDCPAFKDPSIQEPSTLNFYNGSADENEMDLHAFCVNGEKVPGDCLALIGSEDYSSRQDSNESIFIVNPNTRQIVQTIALSSSGSVLGIFPYSDNTFGAQIQARNTARPNVEIDDDNCRIELWRRNSKKQPDDKSKSVAQVVAAGK